MSMRRAVCGFTFLVTLLFAGAALKADSTLKGNVTGDGFTGATTNMVAVDASSGSAVLFYPITVPPGRSGVQPDLSINYNSSANSPSILGRGWSLNLPFVQRSTRSGQPAFTATDSFVLRWAGRSLNLTPISDVPANGVGTREFRTESETFMKLISTSASLTNITSWDLWDGSGRHYVFGTTTQTSTQPARSNGFIWMLSRIDDQYGNYLEIDYWLDAGTLYPKQIRYTGNTSLAPANRIQFYYESRYDVPTSRMGGTSEVAYRLRHIRTYANGTPAGAYLFDYTTASPGAHPIDVCTTTTCSPSRTLCPNGFFSTCNNTCDANTGLCTNCTPPACTACTGVDCGRIYRDCGDQGHPSCVRPCSDVGGQPVCGTCTPPSCRTCKKFCSESSSDPVSVDPGLDALLSGEPTPDGAIVGPGQSRITPDKGASQPTASPAVTFSVNDLPSLLNKITQFDGDAQLSFPPTVFTYYYNNGSLWNGGYSLPADHPFVDITCGGGTSRTSFDQGTAIRDWGDQYSLARGYWDDCGTLQKLYGDLSIPLVFHYCASKQMVGDVDVGSRFVDIDGNGVPDLIYSARQRNSDNGVISPLVPKVYLNGSTTPTSGYAVPVPFVQESSHYDAANNAFDFWSDDLGVRFADVNGDGLVDLVQSVAWSDGCLPATEHVYLNVRGKGWISEQTTWTIPAAFVNETCGTNKYETGLRLLDINNDGMADLVKSLSGESPRVWLNHGRNDGTGTPWELVSDWSMPDSTDPFSFSTSDAGVRFGDVDADGLVDIIVSKMWDGTPTRKVYLHRGGKGWAYDAFWSSLLPGLDFVEHLSGGAGYDMGVRVATSPTNGAADFVVSRTTHGCPSIPPGANVNRNMEKFSNLLKSVTNPLGGTTTLTYASSAVVQGAQLTSIGFIVPVVTKIDQTDGMTETQTGSTHTYTTQYEYREPYYHRKTREFRGFQYVTTYPPGGETRIDQKFVQDRTYDVAPLAGALERSAIRKKTGEFLHVTVNTFAHQDRTVTSGGVTVPADPPFFDYLVTSDDYQLDWTQPFETIDSVNLANPVKQSGTTYTYQFEDKPICQSPCVKTGKFVSLKQAQSRGDTAISTDDLFSVEEYINDPVAWRIGLPKHRTGSSASFDAVFNAEKFSESWLLYDGAAYGSIGSGGLAKGNLTSVERWPGGLGLGVPGSGTNVTSSFGYDSYGHVISVSDPDGHTTCTSYGGSDPSFTFPVQVKTVPTPNCGAATDHVTGLETDRRFGTISKITTPSDGTVTIEYDGLGRTSKAYNSLTSAALPTSCYTYNMTARPAVIASFQREKSGAGEACGPNGMLASATFFDGMGRAVQSKSEASEPGYQSLVSRATIFGPDGRAKSIKKPFFSTDSALTLTLPSSSAIGGDLEYDAAGRPTRLTLPAFGGVGTRLVEMKYPGWTVQGTDPENRKTETDHDAFGRIAQRRTYYDDSQGGGVYTTTSFDYDRLGRLRGITDAGGNRNSFSYDGLSRLIASTQGQYETTRGYNLDGTLSGIDTHQGSTSGQVWPGVIPGLSATYTYDELHRPTTVTYADGSGAIFRYDGAPQYDALCGTSSPVRAIGHLTSTEDLGTGVRQDFLYDAIGRLTGRREIIPTSAFPNGACFKMSMSLDALNRAESLTYPDGSTVGYLYGADGRVASIPGYASNIAYNETGDLRQIRYANGLSISNKYDQWSAQLQNALVCLSCTPGAPDNIVNSTYSYTPAGYVSKITDLNASQAIVNERSFGLDQIYRLTSANATADDSYHGLQYTYDVLGNMTGKEGANFTYGGSVEPHQITSTSTGLTLTYGSFGELRSMADAQGRGRVFSYDGAGNLRQLQDSLAGLDTLNTHNPQGFRVRRIESAGGSSTETVFVGDLYEESAGKYRKYIPLDGIPFAEVDGLAGQGDTATLFYNRNEVNGIGVVTDALGRLVQRIEYRPYGAISRSTTETSSLSFQFAGARRDPGSGLYDFGARVYDPQLGTFLSIDPVFNDPLQPMDLNPYAYARGNPTSHYDVGGLGPDDDYTLSSCSSYGCAGSYYGGSGGWQWGNSGFSIGISILPENWGVVDLPGGGLGGIPANSAPQGSLGNSTWQATSPANGAYSASFDPNALPAFSSHWLLRSTVPGQVSYDNLLTSLNRGQYGDAAINTVAGALDVGIFITTLPEAAGAKILGLARGLPSLVGLGERQAVRAVAAEEGFHYTFSRALTSIEEHGLMPGSYVTPNGALSPLQAQIDLALAPNRGLPDALLRIDLAGLREAGFTIPEVTQVPRAFGMPGGGYEMYFPYSIPPEFIRVVRP